MISMFGRLRRIARKSFPERQLFFRVQGEITFVTLTVRRQLAIGLMFAVAIGWVSFATFHYLAFDWMLAAERDDTRQAWVAYMRTESERKTVVAERDGLKDRVRGLELTLAVLQVSQEKVMARVTRRTEGQIGEVTRLIEMTGLDVDRLLEPAARTAAAAGGKNSGQGGPFFAAREPKSRPDPLRIKVAALDRRMVRWSHLEKVVRSLPLTSPLDNFRMTSSFGPRKDPVNKRWAHHFGLDMANYLGAPILTPAPGKVVFAGRNGRYGRYIEIDHGFGLRTRYGHLKKIEVKKGATVGFRQQIGLLGNSGRSTGPHLHYEIVVNGKPIDPMKFFNAGKYFFKVARSQ